MITFIAALDNKNGIANDHGIPWLGKLPTDIKHFRDMTSHQIVVMGYKTYTEFAAPLSERRNIVATHTNQPLRPGFEAVADIRAFLEQSHENVEDIWVIGGAGLFATTLDLADSLDLTLINKDFHCTKFFPEFRYQFTQTKKSEHITENGITFYFTEWYRKT